VCMINWVSVLLLSRGDDIHTHIICTEMEFLDLRKKIVPECVIKL
jgi:hypothetical protein